MHSRLRTIALAFFGALVLTATAVGVVVAATNKKPPKPVQMKFACASKQSGIVRYATKASACRSTETAIDMRTGSFRVCIKQHGRRSSETSASGNRRLPAGSTRLVTTLTDCGPHYQPNEKALTMPRKDKAWFCAVKRTGQLRWVVRKPRCRTKEIVLFLPARTTTPTPDPTTPQQPGGNGNGNPNQPAKKLPIANNDSASTTEDAPTTIDVRANDTDPDGDPFNIESVNTSGVDGTVSVTGDGKITYNPNGLFEALAPGASDTETFTYTLRDRDGVSPPATVTVTVNGVNDAPLVAATAGSTAYTENGASTVVDNGVTVADVDDANISSAVVRMSVGFEAGDELLFTNASGITGSYNAAAGILTLSGSATKAQYQAALRSVQYRNTSNDNPATAKTVEFKVNDGDADSAGATKALALTRVNDAPAVDTTTAALAYAENDGPVAIDPDVDVTDPDSAELSGATISITFGFDSTQDDLAFTNANGITGTYDSGTGILTLTGNATTANYQAALRSVTYENSSNNPSTSRTVSFQVTDTDAAPSNTDTRDITITPGNDEPVVTTSAGSTAATEDAASVAVDSALTVTDTDDTNIESAQVRISSAFQAGDALIFVDQNGISGNYNSGTGVLTLTGTATLGDYQTALRSVAFQTTNNDPATSKTVEFTVNDGDDDSNQALKTITVTGVNDPPTLNTSSGSASYTEDGSAAAVDPALTASDPDSAQLQGATVSITSNFTSADGDTLNFVDTANISGTYNSGTGVLTLTGADTVANYQIALRSITFSGTSDNPSTATRTVSFQVDDGGAVSNLSNVATRDVTVSRTNDAPDVNTSAGATAYTEGNLSTQIDGGLTVSDADDTNLEGAQVSISTNFESGDDLTFTDTANITGAYSSGTGVLTLTGTDTVANYETALRSVGYKHNGNNPGAGKTIEFTANDGDDDSAPATKAINITGVNDGPLLTTTAAALTYAENAGPLAVDNALTLDDPENDQIGGATVAITAGFNSSEDTLVFVDTANITGTYNSGTGVLTLSGNDTEAAYQAALRSVTYENTSQNPSTTTRTVSFQATDTGSPNEASNAATRDINVTPANDAPVVTPTAGSTAFTEGDPATTIDVGITAADVDDTNLEGGQVRISSGFQSGDDLVFVDQNGISGVYNTGTGVLTLTGTSSVANYQTALQSIQFQSTNDNPVASKTVEFKVNDGDVDSNLATKEITVSPSNDGPTIDATNAALSYTEGNGAVAADNALVLTDPDSSDIQAATVQISANFVAADDELAFTDTANITGSYNDTTGTLTLSGTDTVAAYQSALRSVTFENVSQAPSGTKTLSFEATDSASAASNVDTRTVNLNNVNDAPVVTATAGATSYTEGDPATTIDGGITATDVDDTNLEGGQVRITSGFQSGDDLVFVDQNGISGVYNTGTGVLTLTGTSSVANYQTALQSIQFQSTNNNPVASKTVEFKVNDGDVDSNLATKEITVTPVNSAPIITTGAALGYTENDPATAIDANVTLDEPEDDLVSGASASITANYQAGQDFLAWTDNNLADNIMLDNINSSAQTIVLTGADDEADYQAALRAVTYQNGSENPSTLQRTVTFSATDQPGATGSDTQTITVTSVDDAPQASDDSATVVEDATPAPAVDVLANDLDVDGGPKTIASAGDPANGTVVLTGGTPGQHTGLTYQPDPNYCNDPSGTPDTFTYTLAQGGAQATATVSMTVTCVNDAPNADDETFDGNNSAHGNTTLQVDDPTDNKLPPTHPHTEISGDLLSGDSDVDGPGPLTVTPGTFSTDDGGTVTIESDGDFVFHPAAATSCTDTSDTFDYTVEDSGSPEQTDTGTVTIAIAGCVWYVHNDAAGNSGTSGEPFDTIAQAETASGANHTVFVFDGDGTTTGYGTGFAMDSGERLIGEHEGLVVDPDQGGVLTSDALHPPNAGAHPTLTGINEDVIALDDANEVRGFNIDPEGTGGGIEGAGDSGGGTIDDVHIDDNGTAGTQPGLELISTTGTFNVTDFTYENNGVPSAAPAVDLTNAGTVIFGAGDAGDPTKINKTGGKALDVLGTGLGTSAFEEITVAGSATGGIDLTNLTVGSTTTLGDGSGTDLNLTTTSGTAPAFSLSTARTVTVDSSGTDDVHATGGPAVSVSGTTNASLAFDDVDSTNSAGNGISLVDMGTGTFSAQSGDIGDAAGTSFNVSGSSSGAITYPGALNNGSGATASISGRTGGTVSLTGPISDTNDSGGGITVSGNGPAGTTEFTNASKQLNTVGQTALLFNGSDGHTLNVTNGGLDIDTTSGRGLFADVSGTINVTGSGNTIDSGTGRALEIANTNIGANNVTFERISSNGAPTGIELNNTGAGSGAFQVTGNSSGNCGGAVDTSTTPATVTPPNTGDCTGGTIQSSTDAGVDLTNVPGVVTLTRLRVHGGQDDGVRATSASNGVDVVRSVVSSNGNGSSENGLEFLDVTGTSTIDRTTVSGSANHNANLRTTTSGTHNIDITGSVFTAPAIATGSTGLLITGGSTAEVNADVTGSLINASRDAGLNVTTTTGSPQMDVNFLSNDVVGQPVNAVPASPGVTIGTSDGSDTRVNFSNNDVLNSRGKGIVVNPLPGSTTASTFDATISNNSIGNANVDSGSDESNAIEIVGAGAATTRIAVTNNTIQHWGINALRMLAGEKLIGDPANAPGSADFTVYGNNISNPDAGSGDTMLISVGPQAAGAAHTVCADIGGAGALSNAIGAPIVAAGNFGLQIEERNNADLRFPGFVGDGANQTVIENFIRSRNTGNPTVALVDEPISGGAACSAPALPPSP